MPDSAVENPEAWAEQGVPDPETEEDRPPFLEPDSPLAEMPDLLVPWPDDLELPALVELEPSEDTDFAAVELPPMTDMPAADLFEISDDLILAFPEDQDRFPEQTEFLERFTMLSTVVALDDDDDENIAQLAARAREDEALLGTLLRVYGYYDAQVIRSVGAVQPGDDSVELDVPAVRFDVLPGVRYRFGAVDLGNLGQAPDAGMLRDTFEIQPGDPLSSDKIVEEQFDLDRKLGESGYPFAVIDGPSLLIDHDRDEGDLTMPVSPNGKYVFGDVTSSLPEFLSGRHLATIARFDPGDVYKRSLQQDLRRAVTATGLVGSVTVTPREVEAPSADEPGIVELDVGITKAPLRTVAGAIGYGTEEGVRVEASWEHRNLFPPEGALRVRGIVGTQEQLLGVTFKKNNFGGRDRILTLDAFASTLDSDAFDAQTIGIVGNYERTSNLLFQKPLSWSFGFEVLGSRERPPSVNGVVSPREEYLIAALPVSALIDTTDSLLDPTGGFRLGGRLAPETSRNSGMQSFYLRSQVDASYYQAFGGDAPDEGRPLVVAGRVRLGTMPGADLADIAPSRRYYAGGGGSVRGYGFQQIGPRDTLGEPSGGRSLVELSLEARIPTSFLDGAVSVVPFIDAGSVSRSVTPDFETIRVGAGVGVRYHTGFGPLRVDVATPINPGPDDSPVAIYVSLGQAF
ncbi:MAG: BamA/TamA family outer membrane protein [Alteripontixanthobacter sp.]